MSNKNKITPLGVFFSLLALLLAWLVSLSVHGASPAAESKVLAKFGADVSAVAEISGVGVIVTCKACEVGTGRPVNIP